MTYKESRSTENNEFREAESDSIYDVDLDADVTNVNGEIRWQGNFTKAISLTAGLKHTFNFVKNRARHLYLKEGEMTAAPQFGYDARYNENITALYFSLPMEFGKVSIEAGMRGELYKASGSGLDRSETGLFPTIGLSLPLLRNGNLTASANYSRKVKRPTFWQQSPLVRQFSDYTYTVGNLHLHSSVTNSVSLNFIIVKKITLGTSYANLTNPIRQLFSTDASFPERLYLTYGNTGHEHNVNVYVIGRLSPVKNWIIGGTFILLDQFREKVPGDRLSSNLVFQGQAYSFLSLPKGFSISANGYYYSPMQIGNITTCPIADLSITVNKAMGKGWNIALSADNILQLENGNTSRDTDFYRKSQSKGYACVSVTLSYSFKSGKPVKKKKVINNVDASRLRKE